MCTSPGPTCERRVLGARGGFQRAGIVGRWLRGAAHGRRGRRDSWRRCCACVSLGPFGGGVDFFSSPFCVGDESALRSWLDAALVRERGRGSPSAVVARGARCGESALGNARVT